METTPPVTQEDIARDIAALGIGPGAMVLVHSSLSSIGWVEGGAEAVVNALLESVSPSGTVAVPTLTGTEEDSAAHPPVFDPAASPCWTGRIPETFRRRAEARRSAHPTHSVAAIGPDAGDLIAGHEYCATPCAADSPYGKLAEAGGYVLLLGVTHESNTSLHMVEEVAGAPYHMQAGPPAMARVRRPDGSWEEIPTALHLWKWDRDFPRVEPLLHGSGAERDGRIGAALCHLVEARAMRDVLVPRVRAEPLFLLSDQAREEFKRSHGYG